MLAPFEIHEPGTVQEASQMLRHYGQDAAVYAGGTELLVLMKERLAHFRHLVNIKTIPGLDGIGVDLASGAIGIGPLATHHSIERSPLVRTHLPVFAVLEGQIANVRVRAAGTIGGNLCFAEPHSDPATLLVALNAALRLTSANGSRTIPAEDFSVGLLETARRHDELLTGISIPIPPEQWGRAYQRFKTHERPVVSIAAALWLPDGSIEEARVAAGSVGPKPERLVKTEAYLRGRAPTDAHLEGAAEIAAAETHIEEEGFESVAYKRHVVRVLTRRALRQAAAWASGAESWRLN